MKYQIDVLYRTKAIHKIQTYLDMIMPGKKLSARETFEFDTKEPLTDEELIKIKDCCPWWADGIRVYPVTNPAVEIH